MKKINTYIIALTGMVMLAFSSCKKDETRVVAGTGSTTALSATTTTFAVTSATAANNITTLNWNTSNFGYNAVTSYALEFDRKGNNFAAPVSVAVAGGSSKVYTVGDINAVAIQAGFAPDKAAQLEVRLKATISPSYAASYSNVVTLNFAPYRAFVTYPSIYAPGAYQGWTPATAQTLASVKDDKNYEGYVNFTAGNLLFKITSNPDWDHTNYGLKAGLLATDGDNISVPTDGYYLLKANTDTKAFSATKVNTWSLNGTATNNADQNLTFDAATQTWKGNITLATGTFKFRANGANTIVLGDKTPVTTFLMTDGAAITVPAAGQYQVILNLSVSGNYYYELNKI
ncbi:SusE domain-containing protein [Mucilaginibacter lacusdianchii]|uniref:SusE domain-containing protein n=1 Tax=Mucilaginibacter lacusdianchii TaxID=2684211 RepID=UPI00131E6518|nr:SusE domain-containing protein [Mucilaginibacter sp. JXJ CY 39]